MKSLKARLIEQIHNAFDMDDRILGLKKSIDFVISSLSCASNIEMDELFELASFNTALTEAITGHVTELNNENSDLKKVQALYNGLMEAGNGNISINSPIKI